MKKQSIFVLAAVVLLLLAIPCIASAGISNIRCTYQDTGDVLVRWDDSGSGDYLIKYELSDWSNGRYYYENSSTNYVTLSHLIPGATYKITVVRGSNSSYTSYQVPRPMFRDYTSTGRGFLKMTESTFSISDLKATPNKTFEFQVSWPNILKYSRDYAAKVVLKTPLGYTGRVFHYESFTFENRYSYRYLTYMMMPDWLEYVEGDFGSIPTGRYTFEFYVNGALYETIGFSVGR